jgi:hypothetical protein
MVRALIAAAAFAISVTATPSPAADGVIEINQAIALAGGVNGDLVADAAGFPVRITEAGSYRLTGNLAIPLGSSGIQIDAINVTLDLGGFVVGGPNSCTGYPTTSCAYSTANPAIASEQFLVVVRNGSILSSEGIGIALLGASSEVDQVRVLGCGGTGINVGAPGVSPAASAGPTSASESSWATVASPRTTRAARMPLPAFSRARIGSALQ